MGVGHLALSLGNPSLWQHRAPLEMWWGTQSSSQVGTGDLGSFRVVVGPPLELHGAALL